MFIVMRMLNQQVSDVISLKITHHFDVLRKFLGRNSQIKSGKHKLARAQEIALK